MSGVAYLSWMLMLPLILWMGVRSFTQLALSWGFIALTGVVYLLAARRPTVMGGVAVALLTAVGHGFGTRMFGPVFWVPGVVAMCMLAFAIQPVRALRLLALVTACLSFLVPTALEWAGVLAPSYSFAPGQLVIHARMLDLPRGATLTFLLLTSVGMVLTPFLFLSNIRDALFSAQRRLQLQAWQLRQLVPDEAQAAAVPPQQSGWHQLRGRRRSHG
jgi:serine/threonine-protein kinase